MVIWYILYGKNLHQNDFPPKGFPPKVSFHQRLLSTKTLFNFLAALLSAGTKHHFRGYQCKSFSSGEFPKPNVSFHRNIFHQMFLSTKGFFPPKLFSICQKGQMETIMMGNVSKKKVLKNVSSTASRGLPDPEIVEIQTNRKYASYHPHPRR